MLQTLRNAWKIEDIRKKLLYTLLIIIIFRFGSSLPVPFLDPAVLKTLASESGDGFFGYINILSGGSFSQATIFALSITPYINASIIVQLLTIAIPALERMQKEGEEGRKKLGKITRYVTISLALIQSIGYFLVLRNKGALIYTSGFEFWFACVIIIAAFTAGSGLVVWLGERINEKGIGNGISIILFAGIVSRGPAAAQLLWSYIQLALGGDTKYFILVPLIVLIFLGMVVFTVIMTQAERRIPVQYSKRVVGRKMYGGQSTHIPIKLNMNGVMPIIFASSIVSLPSMIGSFFPTKNEFWTGFFNVFNYTSWLYAIIYFLLIVGFNYFYVAVQYNPIEIANNLRKNNGAIPGIRPGKPTSDFIQRVVSKITFMGAMFLAIMAIFPILFSKFTLMNVSLGGTTLLIVVGVALETVRTLESQMMMRHHKGFLE